MPAPIPGQAKSPDEPFGAATTDNGGNFADFSAFEVNIVYSCCIANGLKPDNKSQILSLIRLTKKIGFHD